MNADELTFDESLIDSYNNFGLTIFQSLFSKGQNVFSSPLGLALSLALLANGADGDTKREILEGMLISELEQEELNTLNRDLVKLLSYSIKELSLDIATSIWFNDDIQVKERFQLIANEYYFSEINTLNLADPSQLEKINQWVRKKTNGKIMEIIDPSRASGSINFLIYNVIYFKGAWIDQFDEKNTKPETFYLENGKNKIVPMMEQNNKFLYAKTNNFEVIRLPYGKLSQRVSRRYEMVMAYIVLPAESNSLSRLVNSLSYQSVQNTLESMSEHKGPLKIPRFTIECMVDLERALYSVGMGRIFTIEADFSKATDQQSFISRVNQKTVVDFNEKGTEIATVTEIEATRSLPMAFSMTVNRPFLLMIMDRKTRKTSTILYIGAVYDP